MQNGGSSCGALSKLTPFGASYYAKSTSLCPEHYQLLMDKGWRRSGTLLYLPDASRSCCPHYTIRLPAAEFKPNRDQRQALHRWNRYVLGDKYGKEVAKRYPKSKAEKTQGNKFDLLSSLHESEVESLVQNVESEHTFTVTLEPDTFTEEKFTLFSEYQKHVHHETDEDITRSGFERFLCGSPLHRHEDKSDGKPLGSYHQCYRLDGRLIAMGVLDLLPSAVSGVYFLYHSDYEKWSFGKLSALREAALALEQGYEYYYMGYYIHGCMKMRYKGDYRPQYVLDYHNGKWDVLDDEMRALMERRKWASMSLERERGRERESKVTARSVNGEEATEEASDVPAVPDKDDPEDLVIHPTPLLAMHSGLSILALGVPGVLTPAELQAKIDLDIIKISLGGGSVHEMQDIVSWDSGSLMQPGTVKGRIAEYAAAVGPQVASEVIVDFSRG